MDTSGKLERVRIHADQILVPLPTATRLIHRQFPQWRDLPVRSLATHGTVNAIFRIGDEFTARFPIRPREARVAKCELLCDAAAALELHGRTRFPTPEPLGIGEPGFGYPMPWSVQTWIPGVVALDEDPSESVPFAHDLAEFIQNVRTIETSGRRFNGGRRGGHLYAHDAQVSTYLNQIDRQLDASRLRTMWATFRELPRGDAPDTMTHGDLVPGNILVSNARLSGIIDVGGIGPRDPAVDLVGAWHLLGSVARNVLRDILGCDDLEWERGKAWAFEQALGLTAYYSTTSSMLSQLGQRTLERICADAGRYTD